jgi:hypothetical protein
MAFIVTFGFHKFEKRKGTLFGRGIIPITLVGLGICQIIKFEIEVAEEFQEFVEKNLDIDQFLIKNSAKFLEEVNKKYDAIDQSENERLDRRLQVVTEQEKKYYNLYSEAKNTLDGLLKIYPNLGDK